MEILRIYGQSMFPTLKHGARVLVNEPSLSQIRPRDIIVFKKDSQIICHRVIRVSKDYNNKIIFYTKGDFNFKSMDTIDEKKILGRVVGVYKNERLKTLRLEHSYIYYLFINIFSFIKGTLQWCLERLYYFSLIRRLVKILFPLKIDYLIVDTESLDEDFKSFSEFFPFNREPYDIIYKLLATHKKRPTGKLWILKDKMRGDIFIYGPYVKVLYRARYIGTGLVRKALALICNKIKKERVYAIITPNKSILPRFFKKFGFIFRENDAITMGDSLISILKKPFLICSN